MNEKIKNYTGIALIVLLLVASYGIFQYTRTYSNSAQSPRNFTVSGNGKVVGIPDIAQFSYGVITQGTNTDTTEGGMDIEKLQSNNSKKGNSIIAFLKSNGIDEKDIQTQNYNIEPSYSMDCPKFLSKCIPPEIVEYRVNQTVLVKVRNFAKIDNILSGITSQGANSVSQLYFMIDDPTMLQNQAKAKAIKKAKTEALTLAKAGEFRLGRLISISEGNSYPQPMYYATAMGTPSFKESVSPTIEPGSQEISTSVTLTYEIW